MTTTLLSIDQEGRITWCGREVETDDNFRAAMLDLAENMRGTNDTQRLHSIIRDAKTALENNLIDAAWHILNRA